MAEQTTFLDLADLGIDFSEPPQSDEQHVERKQYSPKNVPKSDDELISNICEKLLAGESVLYVGPAGCGKSYVFTAVADALEKESREKKSCEVLRMATTGIASQSIDGKTIHSVCTSLILGSIYNQRSVPHKAVAMLDEAFMLCGDKLRLANTELNRRYNGVSWFFSGDPMQLAAIPCDPSVYCEISIIEVIKSLRCYIIVDERNRRSKCSYTRLFLRSLRNKQLTAGDLKGIRDYLIEPMEGNFVYMSATNVINDRRNREMFEKLVNDSGATVHHLVPAFYLKKDKKEPGPGSKVLEKDIDKLERALEMAKIIGTTTARMSICIGAYVMVTRNTLSLKNGTTGIIGEIEESSRGGGVASILIKTDSGQDVRLVSQTASFRYRGLYCKCIYMPIRLAYAVTVHKSQGLTLPKVVVNMKGMRDLPMLYTAISRISTLKDLRLTLDEGCYSEKKFSDEQKEDIVEIFRCAANKDTNYLDYEQLKCAADVLILQDD